MSLLTRFFNDSPRDIATKKILEMIVRQCYILDSLVELNYKISLFGGVVRDFVLSEFTKEIVSFNDLDIIIVPKNDNNMSIEIFINKIINTLDNFGIIKSFQDGGYCMKIGCDTYDCYIRKLLCNIDGQEIKIDFVGIPDGNNCDFTCNGLKIDMGLFEKQLNLSSIVHIKSDKYLYDALNDIREKKLRMAISYHNYDLKIINNLRQFLKIIERTVKMMERGWIPVDDIKEILDNIGVCEKTDDFKCCISWADIKDVPGKYIIKSPCCKSSYYTVDAWINYIKNDKSEDIFAKCPLCRKSITIDKKEI